MSNQSYFILRSAVDDACGATDSVNVTQASRLPSSCFRCRQDACGTADSAIQLSSQARGSAGPPAGAGGRYNGRYTGDFEFVANADDLDAANGRFGVTPEYPNGTVCYVVTNEYPFISRLFRGRPDRSFYKHPGG